jgi:hypothetical protein
MFEPGEVRFVWLDEDGERTSHYHKTVSTAYAYRKMLLRHLDGEKVWAVARREYFKPEGTGKAPVRLSKMVMVLNEQEMTDEERAEVDACELVMT